MKTRLLVIGLIGAMGSGCGSVFLTAKQDFTVQTNEPANMLTTRCLLQNQSGKWNAAPGTAVSIDRDRHDLHVDCKSPASEGKATVGWQAAHWPFWVNLLAMGIFAPVGWAIDFANDADCKYPETVMVAMAPIGIVPKAAVPAKPAVPPAPKPAAPANTVPVTAK
ncbi:MAG: hypothetical protein U1E83_01245 [Methylotetracoccus sp.]